ncbi:unnamed protein product [Lasius platythorax]|uniref:Uncharacterized protein n=1 Tax=Lasius platythorax TaxID=488582 RepID=A0AAV2NIG8_9HYME
MPIRWLMIFFVLAVFILIDNDGLPANLIKNGQRTEGDSADDVNYPNEGSNSLSEASDSGVSTETKKIPTSLNHQGTTDHRCNENEEISTDCETNYQRLITALSRIAKLRSSEKDPVVTGLLSMANVYNAVNKSMLCQINPRICKEEFLQKLSFDVKISSNLSEGIFNNASNDGIQQGNFHCHAIQDIYIPEIKEKIPSYTCTLGDMTFILSSKRFFQDRRSSLHINIDNDTLRKLNSSTVTPTNSQFNIIPAVLVLKPWHENYDIRNPQNIQDQV